jgi:hypothetical protein
MMHQREPLRDATNSNTVSGQPKFMKVSPGFATPQQRLTNVKTPRSDCSSPGYDSTDRKSRRFQSSTPARPLFAQPYLLRELEPHEVEPTLTVVLDLDETLVSNRRADLPCAILRPYVMEVLAGLRRMPGLELVLWTASTEETGTPVVHQLHANGAIFDEVVFRNDKWFTEPVHTKNLKLLGRREDRVVVFDNAPSCCKLNPFKSVIVEDFHGVNNAKDTTLIAVYRIVETLLTHTGMGHRVSDILHSMAEDGTYVAPVEYKLPDSWAHVDLKHVEPLLIPPHGKYFKAQRVDTNYC